MVDSKLQTKYKSEKEVYNIKDIEISISPEILQQTQFGGYWPPSCPLCDENEETPRPEEAGLFGCGNYERKEDLS